MKVRYVVANCCTKMSLLPGRHDDFLPLIKTQIEDAILNQHFRRLEESILAEDTDKSAVLRQALSGGI